MHARRRSNAGAFLFLAFLFLAFLSSGLSACGDDDADSMQDASTDSAVDAACTQAPLAGLDAATASRDADVDAGGFDNAVWTDFAPEALPQDDSLFPFAVQAGVMRPDGATLWTNVTEARSITLRVWRAVATEGQVALAVERSVTPDASGYIRAQVGALAPATVYHYGFFVEAAAGEFESRSPVGRFRTALAPGMRTALHVGATTCTGAESEEGFSNLAPFPALSLLAQEHLDLLLHLGDVSYNDSAETLAEYRASWSRTLTQKGYRDLFPSTGMITTWDDHEFTDNVDFETEPAARIEAAKQAFFETLAVARGPDDRLWTSYLWGDTAEFIVLDLRSERRPSTRESANPVLISQAQMDFLKGRLRDSLAHFKVVMSSVNIANLPGPWDASVGFNDRWEGYGAQREEVLDFIVDENIDNVWFLAGDLHVGFVARVEPSGPRSRMWEITVGPGGSNLNPLGGLVRQGLAETSDIFPCNQFLFAHTEQHATTTLDFDPIANSVRVRFVDAITEEVLFDETLTQER